MQTDLSLLVTRTIERVRSEYVFAETGQRAAAALEQARDSGRLDSVGTDLVQLCDAMTDVLREATHDLHLRLVHHAGGAPDPSDAGDYAAHWSQQAARTAGGVRGVRRTPDNVAVVELGPFLGLPVYAGRWQSAALDLCHGASGVVLDLRECVGGTPDSTALVCSHFFDPEPVHLTDVLDRRGTQQFWTLSLLPGRRIGPDVPLAVLVSSRTFSGGEELAFTLQELGRATVVGEQTRGGAHPRIGVRVHPQVELALPVASPRSPRSGRNWEGTGVSPDIVTSADGALERVLTELASRRRPTP